MNREELIGKMQMVYIGDKRAMNELIDYYDELHNKIDKAIEYINKNSIYFATSEKVGNYFSNCNCDDLLEILKDGDTNE